MTRKELKEIIAEVLVEMGVVNSNKPQPTTRYSIGEEDGFSGSFTTKYSING